MKKQSNDKPSKADSNAPKEGMVLSWANYRWMLVGVLVIVLGFILMAGGGSKDPAVFNYDIFSWRRITLAPLLVLAGFGIVLFSIMHRFGKKGKQE